MFRAFVINPSSPMILFCRNNETSNINGDASLDEVLHSLRRLSISRSELLVLQALLTVDASLRGLRPVAVEMLAEFRARLHELLGAVLRRAAAAAAAATATPMTGGGTSSDSFFAQLGDLLFLAPTIATLADRLLVNLRHDYPSDAPPTISSPAHLRILQTLVHLDTSDYLRFPQATLRAAAAGNAAIKPPTNGSDRLLQSPPVSSSSTSSTVVLAAAAAAAAAADSSSAAAVAAALHTSTPHYYGSGDNTAAATSNGVWSNAYSSAFSRISVSLIG